MGETTGIAWCDHTFNPWWGCAHVSPGCVNCYAETLAKRYGNDVWGKSTDRRFFGDKHWNEPLIWNRKAEAAGVRRRVFCGSMMDVFEDRPDLDAPRGQLIRLIAATPSLDWLLLTKRPENAYLLHVAEPARPWPPNVWLGVSVEDQRRADERIPKLLAIPAAVRFLSCEPLLGPIYLNDCGGISALDDTFDYFGGPGGGTGCPHPTVDWVIVGGESGPGRRPMESEWTRSIWEQCQEAKVAFFGKQGSGPKSDQQYQMPAEVFATREWPDSPAAALVPEGRLL
jgi:protein gp37